MLDRAAEAIRSAEALLITAGAGMGVDSGLPDFRGPEGFWNAYPPYRKLGLKFQDLADPRWFQSDPALAWGFYGHRMTLYRDTVPHAGFGVLKKWATRMRHGAFVFTSNVDGQFQKAGFPEDRLVECHGTLLLAQCTRHCGAPPFPTANIHVDVDPESFRARPPLPACPSCGALARPNVLMFDDADWEMSHTDAQRHRLFQWREPLAGSGARFVVVELGAGTSIPTVRGTGEAWARKASVTLVRINLREPSVPLPSHVGLPLGALVALTAIDERLADGTSPPQ